MMCWKLGASSSSEAVKRMCSRKFVTRHVLIIASALTMVSLAQARADELELRQSADNAEISVYRINGAAAILTQHADAEFRPYLHPIVAPDGKGVMTEFSPDHHKHQTGIYWGFTSVNGRDYFHHPGKGFWRRVSSRVISARGELVQWETAYELLDDAGQPLMLETQVWSMRAKDNRYLLDLEWSGEATRDLNIGAYDYGGLFVRMPWRPGMAGEASNSEGQTNKQAEGQRAKWVDIGLKIDGRNDPAHIAIFDHPENEGHPSAWRVDEMLGIGPSRARLGAWNIPAGRQARYRHRLVVYTGSRNDAQLQQDWIAYSTEPAYMDYWKRRAMDSNKVSFLTGPQAVEKMTVPKGLEVKLFASDPDIAQPIAFAWDDRGRLWVAENRDYETRGTGFSGSGESRILILEDTDGDGKMDRKKVFMEGIIFPSAIAVGFHGLWVGAAPNLLFVPDRNHDDRADDDIQVRLSGWGIQDRHEVLNSFNWGPDGWLYGTQGFATSSKVGKPIEQRIFKRGDAFPNDIPVKNGQAINGGVWRYHPVKDRFEVVAHGFSNPWGLDFDDHGQMFIIATVIPHLWHIIPGGIYHRQGDAHFNPNVYDDIKTIADHRHSSAAGGARIYLADTLPSEYRNRFISANIHEHSVLSDVLEPKGSGYVGKHGDAMLFANDPQWVGFSVETGPDGAVYILDWHDAAICGEDVHDQDTGRIFRLATPGARGKTGIHIAHLKDAELVAMQLDRNDWFVRRARLQLQQRAAEGRLASDTHRRLWNMLRDQRDVGRKLRALWALHVTKGLSQETLLPLLNHAEPLIRGWAIQLLVEDMDPGKDALAHFEKMTQADASPVVRLYLASALQRLKPADRWSIAQHLVEHGEDAEDHNLPKMIWYGIEPLVMQDTARALGLARQSRIPILTQFIARRATVGGQYEAALAIAIDSATPPALVRPLLQGVRDGLPVQADVKAPGNLADFERRMNAVNDAEIRDLTLQIGQVFGSESAARAQLAALQDTEVDPARRRQILQSLGQRRMPAALDASLRLLDDKNLRDTAIRALANFDDPRIAPAILKRYSSWTAIEKSQAIDTLAARRGSAMALFDALRKGSIPKTDVSAFDARQLRQIIGPGFVDFWGKPIEKTSAAKVAELAKYKSQLTPAALASANANKGKAVYERTCAMCHSANPQGIRIGPEITGSTRSNLDYLLQSIVDPNAEISQGYLLVTINTHDGRTLAGNLLQEDDLQITLRLIGREVTVRKADILSRRTSPVSMMPEGLLDSLGSEEVRDLIGFLSRN